MHIVTVAEMRELEAQADSQYRLTSPILMQNAGKSAADIFEAHLLPHHTMNGLEVLFLIGPGNNGGDGLVMARHLTEEGAFVSLHRWKERRLDDEDAADLGVRPRTEANALADAR